MAITSVGYDGIVNEIQWSEMIKKLGTSEYGVVGPTDFQVSTVAGVDRTVSIAAGKAWGHGVYDTSTASIAIQLDSVSTGYRWDLIVIRRNWTGAGGLTTVVKVNGTADFGIPPGRITGPGVTDDQPLALVQITAGQSTPTGIIDLRVWAGNGGMSMWHDMCLSYINTVGTSILDQGNGKKYQRVIGQDGNPYWTVGAEDGRFPIFGIGNSLAGGIPTANTYAGFATAPNFLVQAGTTVNYFDDAGYARITFPRPFPNGLLYISGFNGDDWATGGSMTYASAGSIWGAEGYGTTHSWVYAGRAQDMADDGFGSARYDRNWARNRIHRINWLAIGW